MNVNAIPGLAPLEKTGSKLSVIKSRAVHDSNIDNPYVSFTFQENLTNNRLKWYKVVQFLLHFMHPLRN